MTIFVQLFDRILPNLENYIFFLSYAHICQYLATKWHVWRILIDIGNILKNMKIYWKVARLDNIEKILNNIEKHWKPIWKIFVSWLITPDDACNLEFEILAYMPYDQKIVICQMTTKIQSLGGRGNNITIILHVPPSTYSSARNDWAMDVMIHIDLRSHSELIW